MNDLQIFTYNDTPLRTVEKDGELWWVLKDVCLVLGINKTADVAARLDSDEKGVAVIDTPGGKQEMHVVNEPGLYKVILRSDKPDAKDMMRWVTHDVLPSIRKTGSYTMQPMSPAQLIAAQAQVLVDMEKKMEAMQTQTIALEAKVDTAIKAFSRPAEDHWKSDMDKAIKDLCADIGWSLPRLQGKLYAELEEKANCNINMRVTMLRKRKRKNGMRYKDAQALNKLDAIAADKQLRAIFESVVRTEQARAVPTREEETV